MLHKSKRKIFEPNFDSLLSCQPLPTFIMHIMLNYRESPNRTKNDVCNWIYLTCPLGSFCKFWPNSGSLHQVGKYKFSPIASNFIVLIDLQSWGWKHEKYSRIF